MRNDHDNVSYAVGQVGTTVEDINLNILAAALVIHVVMVIPVEVFSWKLAQSNKVVRRVSLHHKFRRRIVAIVMAWWRHSTNVRVLEEVVGLIQSQADAPVEYSIAVYLRRVHDVSRWDYS